MAEKKSATDKITTPDQELNLSNPAQEKRRDVLNVMNALASAFGIAVLFWIGWAYEVNWYSYFGVNISQVSPPLEQIIIQSVPAILSTVMSSISILLVYLIIKVVISAIISSKNSKLESQINSSKLTGFKLGLAFGWGDVPLFIGFFCLAILILSVGQATFFTRELGSYYPLEFGVIVITLTLPVYILSYLFASKKPVEDASNLWLLLYMITVLMLSAFSSALSGILDAAEGVRRYSGNWLLQEVYISTPNEFTNLNFAKISCNGNDNCLYGPFGLVGENEKSYFLVKWKNGNQKYYQRNPGLYILPRDGLVILPANDSSLLLASPSATPTLIPQPTQTMTITPKPPETATPTLNSTITSTPSQP